MRYWVPARPGLAPSLALAQSGEDLQALNRQFSAKRDELFSSVRNIIVQADKLAISTPHIESPEILRDPETAVPYLNDLVSNIETGRTFVEPNQVEKVEDLADAAAELLRATLENGNAPSEQRLLESSQRSAVIRRSRPRLQDIRDNYLELFDSCTIRSKHQGTVAWYVSKLKDPGNQARYKRVARAVCAPWFFIGIIHGMEAGFNFRGHLHNGDSLRRRTRNIPRNRPKVWNPPSSWEASAVDAIRYDKFVNKQDWDLATMLYRWEAYNGFRSRTIHKINTPYLWSFSNHYTKRQIRSRQCLGRQCGLQAVRCRRHAEGSRQRRHRADTKRLTEAGFGSQTAAVPFDHFDRVRRSYQLPAICSPTARCAFSISAHIPAANSCTLASAKSKQESTNAFAASTNPDVWVSLVVSDR